MLLFLAANLAQLVIRMRLCCHLNLCLGYFLFLDVTLVLCTLLSFTSDSRLSFGDSSSDRSWEHTVDWFWVVREFTFHFRSFKLFIWEFIIIIFNFVERRVIMLIYGCRWFILSRNYSWQHLSVNNQIEHIVVWEPRSTAGCTKVRSTCIVGILPAFQLFMG